MPWMWAPHRSSGQPHEDFHAQTALEAVVAFLRQYGLPRMLTFDRDPRWVGSPSGRDFPSAFCRMLLCLGILPNICPPRHPERNGFVERYHRNDKYECLLVHQPKTLEEVREVTEAYAIHDNTQRPHQGRACKNRPPREVFPTLPRRAELPALVDPDAWLTHIDGHGFLRQIKADGRVVVDRQAYYVKQALAGHRVSLTINAPERCFDVFEGAARIKQLPIKGLLGSPMPLEAYVELMGEQARSEERLRRLEQVRRAI